jgi:VIT1/CCC1 family predicted Fe2+/Mn2+ transporter
MTVSDGPIAPMTRATAGQPEGGPGAGAAAPAGVPDGPDEAGSRAAVAASEDAAASAVAAAEVAEVARTERRAMAPAPEHHHRDVQRGGLRAAVFGVQDGLVSNALLVLGFAGADSGPSIVRLAGLVGLLSGAVSMASGEYNSMQVQRELFEQELSMERRELSRNPYVETVELTQIYQSRGFDVDQARKLAQAVMSDPEQALEVHAREELGISPTSLGSPTVAAASSFGSFTAGALVPILPWFVSEGGAALAASVVLVAIAAAVVGSVVSRLTRRGRLSRIARQVAFTLVPAGLTYVLGSVIGVHLG